MKPVNQWAWGAGGKHPVAKDYIMVGQDMQVLRALSRWIEEGYSKVKDANVQHSWRFFTKGLKTDELACGLVRDSRDGAGRPFPLIIMGYGRMEGWEKRWDLLPYALDDVWERMEFMSVKRFFDLDEMKGDISRLPQPVLDNTGRARDRQKESPSIPSQLSGDIVSIPLSASDDYQEEVAGLLEVIKDRHPGIPSAVFVGGRQDKPLLMAFMRSLNLADFEKLWATA